MPHVSRRNGESKVADNRINAVKNGDKAAFEELLLSFEPLVRSETARLISGSPDFVLYRSDVMEDGYVYCYTEFWN